MMQTHKGLPAKQVLVIPPMRSPTNGRMLGWTRSHRPDCAWANGVTLLAPYVRMPVKDIPAHVLRCGHCGGGR